MSLRSYFNTLYAVKQYPMDPEDKTLLVTRGASCPNSNAYGGMARREESGATTMSSTQGGTAASPGWMWNLWDKFKGTLNEANCTRTHSINRGQVGQILNEGTNDRVGPCESVRRMGDGLGSRGTRDGMNTGPNVPEELLPGDSVDSQNSRWFPWSKPQTRVQSEESSNESGRFRAKWGSGSDAMGSEYECSSGNCEDSQDNDNVNDSFVRVNSHGVEESHGSGGGAEGKKVQLTTRLRHLQYDQARDLLPQETELLKAASKGDVKSLNRLLTAGVDLNAASPTGECQGWRALERAAERGHVKAVRRLLKADADSGVDIGTGVLLAAQLAVQGGHLNVVEELLPRMTEDDRFAYTPDTDLEHHPPPGKQLIHLAALGGHVEVLDYLWRKGFDVNAVTNDGKEQTPLHLACENLNDDAVSYLVGVAKCDVTKEDHLGCRASDIARDNGKKELAQLIIEAEGAFSDIEVAEPAVEQPQTSRGGKGKRGSKKKGSQKQQNRPKATNNAPRGRKHLTKNKRELPMGLRNLGNTCYLNAIVQCLFHSSTLTNFFLEENWRTYITNNMTAGGHHCDSCCVEHPGSKDVEDVGSGVKDEGLVSGVKDEGLVSGVKDEGLVSGVKDEGLVSGMKDEGLVSGVKDEGLVSGVKDEGLVSGVKDEGHGSGVKDEGHGSGSEEGHGSGSEGHGSGSEEGHGSGSEEGHGSGSNSVCDSNGDDVSLPGDHYGDIIHTKGYDENFYGDDGGSCSVTYHGEVAERFCALVVALKGREDPALPLRKFKDTIGRYDATFSDTSQQEAHDLLCFLLDALDRDLQGCNRLRPAQVFFGMHLSTIRCKKTNVLISEVEEQFTSLSLPVTRSQHRRGQNLKECLDRYYKKRMLLWDCPECSTTHECESAMEIKKLPQVLAIHLSRVVDSAYDHRKEKVNIPQTLTDMNNYVVKKQRLEYELYAVCHHYGTTFYGHYTATCRASEGGETWHNFDDTCVTPSSGPEGDTAHILFYESVPRR